MTMTAATTQSTSMQNGGHHLASAHDVAPVLPQVLANSRVDIARAIEQADKEAVDLPDRR
jgi:hypothetical protein